MLNPRLSARGQQRTKLLVEIDAIDEPCSIVLEGLNEYSTVPIDKR